MFVALLECCTSPWAIFSLQRSYEVYENIPEVMEQEWEAATSDAKACDSTECPICAHPTFQATPPITSDAATDLIEIRIQILSVDEFNESETIS